MDKYKLVLDIIEHPDKYSSEKLQTILSDPKTKELYNLLCKRIRQSRPTKRSISMPNGRSSRISITTHHIAGSLLGSVAVPPQ